jgi:hypothetical protein
MSSFSTLLSLHHRYGVHPFLTSAQAEQLRAVFESKELENVNVLPQNYHKMNWIEPFE